MFSHLKQSKDYSAFTKMNSVSTDFSNLVQFNMYEGGYGALIVLKIPTFLERLANNEQYTSLINTYKHILEREFRSLDGLSNIDADMLDITDGINTINVVGKVTMQGGTEFSMTYQEKSGSPITRVHELYLTGLRDPRAGQVKHYHGLVKKGPNDTVGIEAGFENEVFTLLYINTDNTMRQIEKAYLIVGAQITNAAIDIYNYTKGDVDFKEVTVQMNGFPITGPKINQKAQKYLDWLHETKRIIVNSNEIEYAAVEEGLVDPK